MSSKEVKAGAAFVELFVKDNKLSAGLRAASKQIQRWAKDTKKYLQGIGTGFLNAGKWGLGIGGAIGGGLFAMTKSFADAGDQVEKMSHRTSMSAEFLSELGYAAQLCGTDIATLEGSVKKMQMLMLDAAQGSQGAIDKLAALGLSYQQLAKLSPEEQFEVLIDRLGHMDEAHRAALAMEIFGKSATQLMPMIHAGTEEIAAMREEARKLGVSMSGKDAQAAAAFSDALTRLKTAFQGIVQHIGAALAPELTDLANWFTKYISVLVKTIDRNKKLIIAFAKWTAIIAGVSAGLIAIGAAFWGLGAIAGAALGTVAAAFTAAAAIISFILSPMGIAIAAITALLWYFGTLADSIEWVKDCFASLFATATKAWKGIGDAIAAGRFDLAMKVVWTAIKLVWTDGINFLYKWWLWFQNQFLTVWNTAAFGLVVGWNGFKAFLLDTFHGFQAAWVLLTKAINDTWAACTASLLNAWDTAYTQIAKGLGWVYAKLTGMDAAEMVRIVEEDHVNRTKQRNVQYDNDQKQRNAKFNQDMAVIGQNNLNVQHQIDDQLQAAAKTYNDKQQARQTGYNNELAQMEADRTNAEKELNDAIAEAAKARAEFEKDPEVKRKTREARDLHYDTVELTARTVSLATSSSNGLFNVAASLSLQSNNPMDKIARNTEETAKFVKRLYQQRLNSGAVVF